MKNIILVFMLLISCYLFAVSSPFTVLESNENYYILEFNLPDYSLTQKTVNGEEFNFIKGNFFLTYSTEGYPILPYYSGNFGVPADGEIRVEVISHSNKIHDGINIYPAEKMVLNNENLTYQFYKNPVAYSSSQKYPISLVEKCKSAFIGDRKSFSFLVNPFQYIASDKKLLVNTQITFKVTISGDKNENRDWHSSSNYIDKAGDEFFINNNYSKKWRKSRVKTEGTSTNRTQLLNEIQLIVDQEGIYKVTYEDIISRHQAWIDSLDVIFSFDWDSVDPRNFELINDGSPVPIYFFGEADGSFDEGDYFEFYGTGHRGDEGFYDDYTSENIYGLRLNDYLGSRMAIEHGGLVNPEPDYLHPKAFQQEIHFEEQNLMHKLGHYYKDFREDIWFWSKINKPDLKTFNIDIEYPWSINYPFQAKVCLVGATYSGSQDVDDHHAIVRLNSSLIGDNRWAGQSDFIFESNDQNCPNLYLVHGPNDLYISLPGDTPLENEQIMLDYIDLKYWREYKTDRDEFSFSKPSYSFYGFGSYEFKLENFSNRDISIYKIGSSKIENHQIVSFTSETNTSFYVKFQDDIHSNNVKYYALTEDKKKKPKNILPNLPSNLKSPNNSAEYVIITSNKFKSLDSLNRLKQFWVSRGVDTEIVDVQDIFDEFNNGIRSAESIKDFLSYAYNNWSYPQLTHVLLLGAGREDERDFSVYRDENIIPFKGIWTYKLGFTPSDMWYGCIVGDDWIPDIAVGRISAESEDDVNVIVDKTIHYMENPVYEDIWHSHVTLTAGGKDDDDYDIFAQQSENVRNAWIPDNYDVSRVYTYTETVSPEFSGGTLTLKDNIDQGSIFLQFMGHGGGRQWADYDLFGNDDIRTLNNEAYPFVGSFSCYGSAFETHRKCIGDALILEPNRGAISHVGFTGLGYLYQDDDWSIYLTEAMFDKKYKTPGEITNFAIAKFYNSYTGVAQWFYDAQKALTLCASLLGDPRCEIILPQEDVEIELSQYNLSLGDTLTITAKFSDDISTARIVICDEDEVPQNIPFTLQVNNGILNYDFVLDDEYNDELFSFKVKVFGQGSNGEVIGATSFAVGQTAVVDIHTIPENPTALDSVFVTARLFDEQGINDAYCVYISNDTTFYNMMHWDDTNQYYRSEKAIAQKYPGRVSRYSFLIIDGEGDSLLTKQYSYTVAGPDLVLSNLELDEYDSKPAVKVLIQNLGNTISPECDLTLLNSSNNEILTFHQFSSLEPLEKKWDYLTLPITNNSYEIIAFVNHDSLFAEERTSNNFLEKSIAQNFFNAGLFEVNHSSNDQNFDVLIPENILDQESVFYIEILDSLTALNQPDIHSVKLKDESFNRYYKIDCLNDALLADSLGYFPNNQDITISFNFSDDDSLALNNLDQLSVYRWNENYKKWIKQGGFPIAEEPQVVLQTDRTGIYGLFRNSDFVLPQISVNVEEQEFTYGGYISGTGVISFVFSDENGIDIIDHNVEISINNDIVNPDNYSTVASPGFLSNIPVKYQLDLAAGNYTLHVSCVDMNGNYNSLDINFEVSTKFDLINVANYPNPIMAGDNISDIQNNEGRTRFTYVLTDDADELTIKIYTVSGRLVKTFNYLPSSVGYHEYPRSDVGWDCRDDSGSYLANGVYFYKVIAKKNGKKIEKIQKMAILK